MVDRLTLFKRLPRKFSLKFFVGAVLAFCFCLGLFILQRQLVRANRELIKLRSELGHLSLIDPEKVNFIAVPGQQDMSWRWRIFVPPGNRYRLSFNTISIPKDGFPSPNCSFFIGGGEEFTLSVICRRDRLDEWKIIARSTTGHEQNLGFLGARHRRWMDGELGYSSSMNGQGKTSVADAEMPVELLRLQITDENQVTSDDGILVWITRQD